MNRCGGRHGNRDPRNGRLTYERTTRLVEHFFRHEFGRLVAVLTRSLGVRRLDLVEDVVPAALVQALETWSRRGVPKDPAGWLYRTARNLAIDALRRERTLAQALPRLAEDAVRESSPCEALLRRRDRRRTAAPALRLLPRGGAGRVPRRPRAQDALRIQRRGDRPRLAHHRRQRPEADRTGADRLRELDVDFDTPAAARLCARLDAVLAVVYLLLQPGLPRHPWRHADPPRPVR